MSEFINTIDILGDEAVTDSIIDRSITEFNDDVITTLGVSAFNSCTALTSVDLPNVTYLGQSAFANCTALIKVHLPNVQYLSYAFEGCKALTVASLPKVTEVDHSAFSKCSALSIVDLACAVKFGYCSFDACTSLKHLILRADRLCVLSYSRWCAGTPIASGTGYIYVPSALIEEYKAATNWTTYANQFRALEDYTVDGTTTGDLDETKI